MSYMLNLRPISIIVMTGTVNDLNITIIIICHIHFYKFHTGIPSQHLEMYFLAISSLP
jgi:hypothetical protein